MASLQFLQFSIWTAALEGSTNDDKHLPALRTDHHDLTTGASDQSLVDFPKSSLWNSS